MYIKLIFIFTLFYASLSATVIPIVTAEENSRLEELADETGANEWRFMTNAGLAVSVEAEKMINFNKNNKITVIIGKGYNGGNALWAGFLLLQKGYQVEAIRLFPIHESPLICQEIMGMFEEFGGMVIAFNSNLNTNTGLIIDGILGASFKGSATGVFAEVIEWANESKQPILSVDIPSGLNGNTGEVGTVGIQAKHTVTFFFPRIGFFIRDGWKHVGTLSVVNLGIKGEILSQINPAAYLMSQEESSKYLTSAEILKLDRQKLANLLGHTSEFTFEESQKFSEKHQLSILFTDYPMLLITPIQKPIIINDVPLYKVSDSGQVDEAFDFLEDKT